MKLATNLVRSRPINIQWIASGLLLTGFVLLCLLLWQLVHAFDQAFSAETLGQLEQQKLRLQQHIESQKSTDKLSLSTRELEDLKRDVQTINQLSGTQGLDLSSVLIRIEQAVSDRVRIQLVNYDAENGLTRLMAEADSSDELNGFVEALQQVSEFRDVVVSDQKQIKQDRKVIFNYQVSFRQRSE